MYKVSLDRFLGYTYENMQNDLGIFARIFPEAIQIDSMGRADHRISHEIVQNPVQRI